MKNALSGKRVVVTRAVDQADELVVRLRQLGADVVHIPAIEIGPPDSWIACDEALEDLEQYHWVIFTSTNGVQFFIERLKTKNKGLGRLQTKQIAAVGERTEAKLKDLGLHVDLVPDQFRAEGLVKAFEQINLQNLKILFPKAQEGRDVLVKGLEALGAEVNGVPVYKTRAPKRQNISKFLASLNDHEVDLLTFTSPSTVRNLISIFGEKIIKQWLANGCRTAVIGGVTAEALENFGIHADILPKKSTVPNLVKAILEYYT
ncbi:MAG: uroporphyrinogen-III synthase [bacterium]